MNLIQVRPMLTNTQEIEETLELIDLNINRNKNNDIQKEIRKKIHAHLSAKSLKKRDRCQDPFQSKSREICANYEFHNV